MKALTIWQPWASLIAAGEDVCGRNDAELLKIKAKRNRWIMRLSTEGRE